VPANGIGGSFDFANLPVGGVDRVEVLRNPSSVFHGADALQVRRPVGNTDRSARTEVVDGPMKEA